MSSQRYRGFLILLNILEPFVRFLKFGASMYRSHYGAAVERRLRGLLYGLFHGKRGVSIGRVLVDGWDRVALEHAVKLYCDVKITCGDAGYCRIGAGTHLGFNTVVSAGGGVIIGENCAISSGVSIYSVSNRVGGELRLSDGLVTKSPVRIGNNVFVGCGAIILPGVEVGDDAIVGAGALVNRNVTSGDIVVGNPAKTSS